MDLKKFVIIIGLLIGGNALTLSTIHAQTTIPQPPQLNYQIINTIQQPVGLHFDGTHQIKWLTPDQNPHFKVINIDDSNHPIFRYHVVYHQKLGWFMAKQTNIINAYYQNDDLKYGQEFAKPIQRVKIYNSPDFMTARWHWSKPHQKFRVEQLVKKPGSFNQITRFQINGHTYLTGDKHQVKLIE